MKYKYEVISLDVWGNEDDGWEVNAAYNSGRFITIADDADDEDIVNAVVMQTDMLTAFYMSGQYEVENGYDTIIFINESETGEPLYQLHLIGEVNE